MNRTPQLVFIIPVDQFFVVAHPKMQSPDELSSEKQQPSVLSSPTNPSMGAGIDNAAVEFEEVSLSNMPVPSVQPDKENAKGSSFHRKKLGGLTMREWLSIAILFLVNLLNYMDRFTIAGVLTDIQKHFGIKDAEAGLLQTVFIIAFMICAPICGYLGDRYNRKYIMIVGLMIWVSAVLASTFIPADSFWAFMLLRSIVGIGEASYSITGPTIIADMFASVIRSRVLMLFYFAIPVGSGLGFIVGSKVAAMTGSWQMGVRVTPPLGLLCIIAIIFIIHEPERGHAERKQGAEHVSDQPDTSYWQDLLYLLKNKTYIWSTVGYTAVVFVTGTLSWWTNAAIEYAEADRRGLSSVSDIPKGEKANIALIFGAIMTVAGIVGVTAGTVVAQTWKRGQLCFKGKSNPRADPIVCTVGSLVACPFLFLGMFMISRNMAVSWVSIFIAVTFLCLNWAVNVDMLLYIVLPKRRALATGMQILVSHLFGDASGPYLIGLISQLVLGSKTSPGDHYNSLLVAFYIPTALLIVSAITFGISAYTLVEDKERFDIAMGYKNRNGKITAIDSGGTGLENNAYDSEKTA